MLLTRYYGYKLCMYNRKWTAAGDEWSEYNKRTDSSVEQWGAAGVHEPTAERTRRYITESQTQSVRVNHMYTTVQPAAAWRYLPSSLDQDANIRVTRLVTHRLAFPTIDRQTDWMIPSRDGNHTARYRIGTHGRLFNENATGNSLNE